MQCAVSTASGLQLQAMQPGGSCVGVVLMEPADVPPNPFYLTPQEGLSVSVAVGSVWVIGWTFRRLRDALAAGPEGS